MSPSKSLSVAAASPGIAHDDYQRLDALGVDQTVAIRVPTAPSPARTARLSPARRRVALANRPAAAGPAVAAQAHDAGDDNGDRQGDQCPSQGLHQVRILPAGRASATGMGARHRRRAGQPSPARRRPRDPLNVIL